MPANACPRHPDMAAPDVCARCGDFICQRCTNKAGDGSLLCPACMEKVGAGLDTIPQGVTGSFDGILGKAMEIFGAIAVPAILLNLIPGVVMTVASFVIQLFAKFTPAAPPTPAMLIPVCGGFLLVLPIVIWLSLRAQAGTMLMARSALFAQPVPGVLEAFNAAAGYPWPLFKTALIEALVFMGVAIVCYLPMFVVMLARNPAVAIVAVIIFIPTMLTVMIFLMIRWALVNPIVVYERIDGTDALTRSWNLVKGRGWMLLVTGIVVAIVGVVVIGGLTLVMSIVAQAIPLIPDLINSVVSTVFGVLLSSVVVSFYYGFRSLEVGAKT